MSAKSVQVQTVATDDFDSREGVDTALGESIVRAKLTEPDLEVVRVTERGAESAESQMQSDVSEGVLTECREP